MATSGSLFVRASLAGYLSGSDASGASPYAFNCSLMGNARIRFFRLVMDDGKWQDAAKMQRAEAQGNPGSSRCAWDGICRASGPYR